MGPQGPTCIANVMINDHESEPCKNRAWKGHPHCKAHHRAVNPGESKVFFVIKRNFKIKQPPWRKASVFCKPFETKEAAMRWSRLHARWIWRRSELYGCCPSSISYEMLHKDRPLIPGLRR